MGLMNKFSKWVAALCVALMALLYIEPAHAEWHSTPAEMGEGGHLHMHSSSEHDRHQQQQQKDGSEEPHAHACGAGAAVELPSLAFNLIERRAITNVDAPASSLAPVSAYLSGLERPPRLSRLN